MEISANLSARGLVFADTHQHAHTQIYTLAYVHVCRCIYAIVTGSRVCGCVREQSFMCASVLCVCTDSCAAFQTSVVWVSLVCVFMQVWTRFVWMCVCVCVCVCVMNLGHIFRSRNWNSSTLVLDIWNLKTAQQPIGSSDEGFSPTSSCDIISQTSRLHSNWICSRWRKRFSDSCEVGQNCTCCKPINKVWIYKINNSFKAK